MWNTQRNYFSHSGNSKGADKSILNIFALLTLSLDRRGFCKTIMTSKWPKMFHYTMHFCDEFCIIRGIMYFISVVKLFFLVVIDIKHSSNKFQSSIAKKKWIWISFLHSSWNVKYQVTHLLSTNRYVIEYKEGCSLRKYVTLHFMHFCVTYKNSILWESNINILTGYFRKPQM